MDNWMKKVHDFTQNTREQRLIMQNINDWKRQSIEIKN
jgi:hypothetical protein